MAARIAGFAAEANQTLQFRSVQFGGLLNQVNALGVVQGRLSKLDHHVFDSPVRYELFADLGGGGSESGNRLR